MRSLKNLWLLPALFLAFQSVIAQAPQTANTVPQVAIRDSRALAALGSALNALGGQAAIGGVSDCVVQGHIEAVAGSFVKSGDFVAKHAGREFRYENTTADGSEISVSGHGHPAISSGGTVKKLPERAAYIDFPAHLALLQMAKALIGNNYSVERDETTQINGVRAIHIHTTDSTNRVTQLLSRRDWFFDSSSGLPLRVEYDIPDLHDPNISSRGALEFSGYRKVSGILIPFQFTQYLDGQPVAVTQITSVTFNVGLNSADFDLGGAQ